MSRGYSLTVSRVDILRRVSVFKCPREDSCSVNPVEDQTTRPAFEGKASATVEDTEARHPEVRWIVPAIERAPGFCEPSYPVT